jgi:hypothetical protein
VLCSALHNASARGDICMGSMHRIAEFTRL